MSNPYEETVASLRDTLKRNGFVRCDIPACNCGSWHHRYGLPERFEQIKDMLAEAGYGLCNENGHLVSKALAQLINDLAAEKERADYAWRNVRTLEAARQEEMKKRDAAEKKEPCNWTQDGYGEDAWDTGCNNRFMLEEGTPSDNRMEFCCFCGHPIDELPGEEQ